MMVAISIKMYGLDVVCLNGENRIIYWQRMLAVVAILFAPLLHATSLYQYTPDDVFTEALRIQGDIRIISQHFNIKTNSPPPLVLTKLKPRNSWQKTYEIMVKINTLRERSGLPRIEEMYVAPLLDLDPGMTHEQVRRIHTELDIFMTRVGITKRASKAMREKGKTPVDVYNLLNAISRQLDEVNGERFGFSHVFSQTMRLLDDLDLIIARLNIYERIGPPTKDENTDIVDVYEMAKRLIKEVERLQRMAAVESVKPPLRDPDNLQLSDLNDLVQFLLAELQPLKAYLLIPNVTVPAQNYAGKTAVDAKQVLEWGYRKITQVRSLEY